MHYRLKVLNGIYAICSFEKESYIPLWVNQSKFHSITRTDDELSILCIQENIPSDVKCEGNWKIIKIDAILGFSLVGVISEISTLLADNNISIFVISTFNTDYICIKEIDFEKAIKVFKDAGNTILM